PTGITEAGDVSRVTARQYQHLDGSDSPFIVGLPTSETVTVGTESLSRSWTYDLSNGFRTSQRNFGTASNGVQTLFTNDGRGNIATVQTATNKVTTYTYSYGRVKNTQSPEYTIERVINPDGTVASE